jgi:lipopolysaccharide export LptBFGC system permease protein LptF
LTFYLGGEILKVFLLALFIMEVIHGCILTVKVVRDFDLDIVLLLPILWRTFVSVLNTSVPIALLFATSLVFGRLIADREINALRSFGVSNAEIVLPPAVLGLVCALGCYFLNGYVGPELRFAFRNAGRFVIDQLQYLGDGSNKRLQFQRTNTIHIGRHVGNELYDILVFTENPEEIGLEGLRAPKHSDAAPSAVTPVSFPCFIDARRGRVVNTVEGEEESRIFLELRGVTVYLDPRTLLERDDYEDFLSRFSLDRAPLNIEVPEKDRSPKEFTNPRLNEAIVERRAALRRALDQGDEAEVKRARHDYLFAVSQSHRRLAYSAIAFVFPVTAALIALFLNSSNRLFPFFVGVTVTLGLFFPLELQGRELGESIGHAWLLGQLGNLILLLLAAALYLALEHRLPRPLQRRSHRRRLPRGRPGSSSDSSSSRGKE